MKSILNFPYRFTKPNSRIKNGFYVCRIVRVGSPLTGGYIFTFEIFSVITWIVDVCNFDIPRLVSMPFSNQIVGKNIKFCRYLTYFKLKPVPCTDGKSTLIYVIDLLYIYIYISSYARNGFVLNNRNNIYIIYVFKRLQPLHFYSRQL